MALLAFLWCHLVPDTSLSQPLRWLLFDALDVLVYLGLLQPFYTLLGYQPLVYLTGICLALTLLLSWMVARCTLSVWARAADRTAVAVVLWGILYLTDWLHTTRNLYDYGDTWWLGYGWMVFLAVVLLPTARLPALLTKGIALAIGAQAVYAIAYHMLDIRQFQTPHFGARTGGTVGTPNQLYPVVMMGVPLCLALALGASRMWERALWFCAAALSFLALWFTYTRTGWIALALTLPLLTIGQGAPIRHRWAKRVVYALSAALLLATALIRTGGDLLGNPSDRSFWGRFAIWQVALTVVAQHPFIGGGVGTYPDRQRASMTEHLLSFNPMNTEPKSLYLLIPSDVGLVGLALFLLVVWRYVQLYRQAMPRLAHDPAARALVTGCTLALLSILVAGVGDSPVLEFGRTPSTFVAMAILGIGVHRLNAALERPRLTREQIRWRERRFLLRTGLVLMVLCVLAAVPLTSGLRQYHRASHQIDAYRSLAPARPRFTPLEEIAEPMRHALIASEDGNFYQHQGVDWQALHRALRVNIRSLSFKRGGSTITMQTARYLFVGREKTIPRKLAEILLALQMERRLSKGRILELCLNSARFGLGAEDIGTASAVYFGKRAKDLTLAEAAFLAGVLPEPPRTRAELTEEKVERCKRRALGRLRYFFSERYSPEQIEHAMREQVVFVWES